MSFWYMASPYSLYPNGIEAAHRDACAQAALLIRAGVPVFSPIVHSHPIAINGHIDPLDHSVWMPADQPFMDCAKGLIVCELDGWDSSYGIGIELAIFKMAGKPIVHMMPGEVQSAILELCHEPAGHR